MPNHAKQYRFLILNNSYFLNFNSTFIFMNKIHKTGRTWQTPFGAPLLAILLFLGISQIASAQYCAITHLGGGCFTNVTLGTINDSPAACATPFYTLVASSPTTTTNLAIGTTVSLTVTTDATSGATSVSVWIDYNGNTTFEATEHTQVLPVASTANTATVSIAIPGAAIPGATRMRLRSRFANNPNGSGDACINMGSGEGRDYTVTLTGGTACTGQPAANTSVSSSASACSGVPFNLSLSTPYTTSGITYQWQSSPTLTGTYTNITGATTATYVATQTVASFYQCVISCSASPLTRISTPVSVGLNAPTACYCAAAATQAADTDIGNVTFGTLNNGSATPILSNPAATGLYTDNTAVPAPSVARGASIPLSLSQITGGTTFYTAIFAVYIDYNQDGDFADTGELVFSSTALTGATAATQTGTVIIPATATLGNTRMRVVLIESGAVTPVAQSCNPIGNAYGEVEDYTVNIIAGTPCPTITFANTTATNGTVGTAYTLNGSATASSGILGYTVTPTLPAGLVISATTGQITGTPTAATTSATYTITASTSTTCSATQSYTFGINAVACPTITFANTTATSGTVGTAYTLNGSATASSGTLGYTVTPTLPAGLVISATTGQITGTPTAVTASATYVVTASTSGTCSATQSYTFAVNAAGSCSPIVVTPASGSPVFTIGTPPNIVFNATGGPTGTPSYTFAVTGTLPTGVTVVGNATVGAPTTAQSGSFTVTATATTGTCPAGSATYLYNVTPAGGCTPALTPTLTLVPAVASANVLVSGTVGVPFSQQFTGAGVTGTYTYALTTPTSSIPAGLTFNNATGLLSGTPSFSTSFTFRVIASAGGCPTAPNLYTLVINPSPTTAIDNSLANLVKVSPNPSKGDFNVDFGTINMAKSSVRVYDAQGKVVFTSENNSNLMTISLDKFANGIYLMEVETSKGRILKRLAKQ